MLNAFKMADEVLLQGVQGITDLITTPGLINTDFADVKMILTNAGTALMGVGYASGDGRAVTAARAAISSPLLEASIEGARGILLNVSGPSDLGLFELNDAADIIAQAAHPDANIIFGAVIDDTLGDEVRLTVIAAGFDRFEGEGTRAHVAGEAARPRRRRLARRRGRARPRRRRLRRAGVPALSDAPDDACSPSVSHEFVNASPTVRGASRSVDVGGARRRLQDGARRCGAVCARRGARCVRREPGPGAARQVGRDLGLRMAHDRTGADQQGARACWRGRDVALGGSRRARRRAGKARGDRAHTARGECGGRAEQRRVHTGELDGLLGHAVWPWVTVSGLMGVPPVDADRARISTGCARPGFSTSSPTCRWACRAISKRPSSAVPRSCASARPSSGPVQRDAQAESPSTVHRARFAKIESVSRGGSCRSFARRPCTSASSTTRTTRCTSTRTPAPTTG